MSGLFSSPSAPTPPPPPVFANGETVANLDDTGTGTANGDTAQVGRVGGNFILNNIQYGNDLDAWIRESINGVATQNGNVPHTPEFHIQSDNSIFVGDSTGKFINGTYGTLDWPGWKAILAAQDNKHDLNSTNPPT
jgi:hypothetical protein